MTNDRHVRLASNPKVAAWFNNREKTAESTSRSYIRAIGLFCEKTKTTPIGLLKLSTDALVEVWREYAKTMQDKEGLRPAAATARKAITSWLVFNGREAQAFALNKRTGTRGVTIPRRAKTGLPTQSELGKAFYNARPQVRAEMAIMAFAGQRIEAIGMRESDDGLRFSDFPEASLDKNGRLQFEKEPTVVLVRKEISKTREPFVTFLGPQGCKYLQEYVDLRRQRGENVTLNSPVIVPEVQSGVSRRRGASTDPKHSKMGRVEFVHPNNIGDSIRAVFRNKAVGIQKEVSKDVWEGITPYNLRHYFSQRAGMALKDDYREFFMGHKAKVAQRYSMYGAEKGLLEELRTAYGTALKFIETGEVQKVPVTRREVLEMTLLVSGRYTEEQLKGMTEEQIISEGSALMKNLQAEPVAQPVTRQDGRERRIVTAEEAESETLALEGWDPVRKLADGRVVMERTVA